MSKRPHVVVVGGGISGLAAAHEVTRLAGGSVRVTVLEMAPAVGGHLALADLGGVTVDAGAESLLARRPEAVRLAERVGLGPDIVHPAASGAYVWSRGRLRSLPKGQLMGIPFDLRALAESQVVSLRGMARIPWDSVLPDPGFVGDRSVGEYVAARLGREVVDRLVEPLLGGVYAGHADDLSLDAVLPQLSGAVRVERSLLRSAARVVHDDTAGAPVFAGLAGGVGRLPAAVAEVVAAAPRAQIRTGSTVRRLEKKTSGWRVVIGSTASPETIEADGVVIAVPAAPASRLLSQVAPAAATALGDVPYASVALVTVMLDRAGMPDLPSGTGFLVPPVDRRTIKAATFSSQKWAWVQDQRPEAFIVRASVGRFGDEAILQREDSELVDLVTAELGLALGWASDVRPQAALVTRWGGSLPQYLVGHLDKVQAVRRAAAAEPALAVCGAAYDGVGVAACIASGEAAAAQVLRKLLTREQWSHVHPARDPGVRRAAGDS